MDADFPAEMMPEIEAFLAEDYKRPRGRDIYDEVFETGLFFPLQRKRELIKMIDLAREVDPPRTVMEIGADKGGGFYHWCKCFTTVHRAICNEIRGTPYAAAFEAAFEEIEFCWAPGSSRDPANIAKIRDFLDGTAIDVLFIDGDKDGMLKDFDTYLPMMKKGGLVLLHDVRDPGPAKAFAALSKRYKTRHILDISEVEEALERAARGVPAANAHEGWLRYWQGASCSVGVIRV